MEKEVHKVITINVCNDFYNMINKFIEDFEKINGIKISIPEASKILFLKIDNKGGLKL